MAATFNVTASALPAIASDKNCSPLDSGRRSLVLGAAPAAPVTALKAGRRKGLELKNGLIAERLRRSESGGGKGVTRSGPVRAEIFIEEAMDEGTEYAEYSIPVTQTAWLYKEYGSKEMLGLAEVAVPKVQFDQVLVKVYAAALNPVDSKRRLGKFQNSDSDLPTVPGFDAAGVVVQVGAGVTKFKVGDRVYGDVSEHCLNGPKQYGSLAQYAAVEEKLIAAIPPRLSFAEAASLPLAIETAYQGFEHAGLKEGQTVLVLGGAGGVGSLAVQLAKLVFKASAVAATTSTAKVDFVKGLGVDTVIDYTKESLHEHPTQYDVVLDTVGKGEALLAMKDNGRAIVLTGPADPPAFRFVVTSRGDILETLNPFLEDGTLKPIVDSKGPFPFYDLVDAFAYLEAGRATGKVVISSVP